MFNDKKFEDKILIYLKICLIFIVATFLFNLKGCSKSYFLKESELLTFEASKRDFCSLSMNQMIQKKLSSKLMDESLYSQVIADNYSAMYLDEKSKISSILSNEEGCKILLASNNGLRSFDFKLEQDSGYPFFYHIKKIHENELVEKLEEE